MAHLLVPINDACEVIPGARYAKSLIDQQVAVKVSLLHVAKSAHGTRSQVSFLKHFSDPEEERANALIEDAARYLVDHRIQHNTFILWDHVVSTIIDAAVLLDCDAIVLPLMKPKSWTRPLAGSFLQKIVNASASVPVVIVDVEGKEFSISGAPVGESFLACTKKVIGPKPGRKLEGH